MGKPVQTYIFTGDVLPAFSIHLRFLYLQSKISQELFTVNTVAPHAALAVPHAGFGSFSMESAMTSL